MTEFDTNHGETKRPRSLREIVAALFRVSLAPELVAVEGESSLETVSLGEELEARRYAENWSGPYTL